MSFNWEVYRELNPDLEKAGLKTRQDFESHYLVHGRNEGRYINIYQAYLDFNPITYKNKYPDLQHMNNQELEIHWIVYGRNEGRCYNNSNEFQHLINGIDMIYWINLDRSIDRRTNMEIILSKINVPSQRIIASDGKLDNIMNNLNIITKDMYTNRTNSEYACLLSHLRTVKEFYESNNNICMILEDDISLYFTKYWHKDIKTIISEAPTNWEIIMLSYTVENPNLLTDVYTKINPEIYSAVAYLINRNGAEKIIRKFNNKWLINENIHTSDYILYNSCNTYTYKYCYFTIDEKIESTIHNSDLDLHSRSKKYSEQIWINFIKNQR